MAAFAQRLEVVWVVEQCVITFMWCDVVNDACGDYLVALEVKLAQRLLLELVISQTIPTLGIVEVMPW